jgi:hypothetical protein
MNDLVDRVATAAGITAEQADSAVRIILSFLHAEGPADKVADVAARLGVADHIAAPAKGGMLGRIGGLFGAGGAMAAFSALSATGLDLGQIQTVVHTVIGAAKETVGAGPVDEIVAAIPGLDRFA